jgi:hypothetical protein
MWAKFNCAGSQSYAIKDLGGILPVSASGSGWRQSDYWVTADIYIPTTTLTVNDPVCGCTDNDLCGESAAVLALLGVPYNAFGFNEQTSIWIEDFNDPVGDQWTWVADTLSGSFGVLYTPGTVVTVEAHITPNASYPATSGSSPNHVFWYFNGIAGSGPSNCADGAGGIGIGGMFALGCNCEWYYITNVKVGSTRGASDYFSDNFSSGDFSNWSSTAGIVGVVASPTNCGGATNTTSVSPSNGCAGTVVTLTGSGYAHSSALTLEFNSVVIPFSAATTDSSGNFTGTFVVPFGLNACETCTYSILISDASANNGALTWNMCCNDGMDEPHIDTPLGSYSGGTPMHYIRFNNENWYVNNMGLSSSTFPPDFATPAMEVVRVDDFGTQTIYPVDIAQTDITYDFGFTLTVPNPYNAGQGNWGSDLWFGNWYKSIYSAKFATDGTNLWLVTLTERTVPYPYLSIADGQGSMPDADDFFQSIYAMSSGYTNYGVRSNFTYQRGYHQSTSGVANFYNQSPPYTDSGDNLSGHYTVPYIMVHIWNGSGFTKIDEEVAKYYTSSEIAESGHGGGGLGQPMAYQGFGAPNVQNWEGPNKIMSDIMVAASPAQPGVLHVLWYEGGSWGQYGTSGALSWGLAVWDSCAPNCDYRLSYTTWSTSAKTHSYDMLHTHIDRTSYNFGYVTGGTWYPTGYTWPGSPSDFVFSNCFELRNDGGFPMMWLASAKITPVGGFDSSGNPNLNYDASAPDLDFKIYDISGGTMTLLQTFDYATLQPMTTDMYSGETPPTHFLPESFDSGFNGVSGFGVSLPYTDPTLGGTIVHLFGMRWTGGSANVGTYYRIPVDGSAAIDLMDGIRASNYTYIVGAFSTGFSSLINQYDWTSDSRSGWFPATSNNFWRLSRICTLGWSSRPQLWPYGSVYNHTPSRVCNGTYQNGDYIYYVTGTGADTNTSPPYRVTKLQIHRHANPCHCAGCDGPIWFYVDGQWRQAGVDPAWNIYVFRNGTWHPVCIDPDTDAYASIAGSWVPG